jgi:hypothetical protein
MKAETTTYERQDFSRRSMRSLEGIEILIKYGMKDLQDYLNFETFKMLKTTDDSLRKNTFTPIERRLN